MSFKLCDFPLDILLDLAKELNLPDSLHLTATCTACAAVLHSPSFWIESLHQMEKIHKRPIPCEPATDLATLPLDKLRNIAIHAYRLRKNWASDSPRPVATRDEKKLILAVIDINYRDPDVVVVSSTLLRAWPCPDRMLVKCVIVNESTVGVLGSVGKDDVPWLFYCRTAEPQQLRRLALEIQPPSPKEFGALALGRDFVVFTQDRGPPVFQEDRPFLYLPSCEMRSPSYGILNVMKRGTEDRSAHRILFWPAEYSAASASSDSALTVSPVCSYQHTALIDRIAVGSSGTSVFIQDRDNAFFLLHYISAPTPHVESRRLPIPPKSVVPWQHLIFALDDCLGVVYMAYSSADPEELSMWMRFKVFEFA
ncbi:hypothetical protein FB45DRAFT_1122181 [Roridomyces roridus]|uniref:F-box domain-containing protein n=1 Tax=Roridomyces roridus TaxID=1738132 RepID=A0AAD7B4Z6_9AGAR|nr:hypothetical protein FB45DRAFT_1122181 [Roridomyces roridus]